MSRHPLLRLAAAALVGSGLALLGAGRSEAQTTVPACMTVRTEARWVPYGYDHVVILGSTCAKDAACTVSTDVNPQAVAVDVKAGATVEVLTFRASPASTFVAKVACTLR